MGKTTRLKTYGMDKAVTKILNPYIKNAIDSIRADVP